MTHSYTTIEITSKKLVDVLRNCEIYTELLDGDTLTVEIEDGRNFVPKGRNQVIDALIEEFYEEFWPFFDGSDEGDEAAEQLEEQKAELLKSIERVDWQWMETGRSFGQRDYDEGRLQAIVESIADAKDCTPEEVTYEDCCSHAEGNVIQKVIHFEYYTREEDGRTCENHEVTFDLLY